MILIYTLLLVLISRSFQSSGKRPTIIETIVGEYVRIDCSTGATDDWGILVQNQGCVYLCQQITACSQWCSSMAILTETCLLSSAFLRRCYFVLQHKANHRGTIQSRFKFPQGDITYQWAIADFSPGLNFTNLLSMSIMTLTLEEKDSCQVLNSDILLLSDIPCSESIIELASNDTRPFMLTSVAYERDEVAEILSAWNVTEMEPFSLGICSDSFKSFTLMDVLPLNECFEIVLSVIGTMDISKLMETYN
eukprot:Blabericola_migrator_1__13514@NODE_986_length_5811_cov_70_946727_g660_i1_p2_GENE_NODE_986_length_5811_cov_70_946727_g660_i1NODE_986_length_5811_cov_70_946727_g660_i1_p2_ORF_typecomplete_len250_score23_52_NODE_986_length_5811_cov_70_946727_g660_i149555704